MILSQKRVTLFIYFMINKIRKKKYLIYTGIKPPQKIYWYDNFLFKQNGFKNTKNAFSVSYNHGRKNLFDFTGTKVLAQMNNYIYLTLKELINGKEDIKNHIYHSHSHC